MGKIQFGKRKTAGFSTGRYDNLRNTASPAPAGRPDSKGEQLAPPRFLFPKRIPKLFGSPLVKAFRRKHLPEGILSGSKNRRILE